MYHFVDTTYTTDRGSLLSRNPCSFRSPRLRKRHRAHTRRDLSRFHNFWSSAPSLLSTPINTYTQPPCDMELAFTPNPPFFLLQILLYPRSPSRCYRRLTDPPIAYPHRPRLSADMSSSSTSTRTRPPSPFHASIHPRISRSPGTSTHAIQIRDRTGMESDRTERLLCVCPTSIQR